MTHDIDDNNYNNDDDRDRDDDSGVVTTIKMMVTKDPQKRTNKTTKYIETGRYFSLITVILTYTFCIAFCVKGTVLAATVFNFFEKTTLSKHEKKSMSKTNNPEILLVKRTEYNKISTDRGK